MFKWNMLAFMLCLTLGWQALAAEGSGSAVEEEEGPVLALKGLCPVCLVGGKEVEGKEEFSSTQGDFIYRFPDAETKKKFDENPAKYAIQMDGLCVVCKAAGKDMKGDPSIFAVHEGKIYIFPNSEIRQKFVDDPGKYVASKPKEGSGSRKSEGSGSR
ncbi:MAG: hypothetical protein AB7F75_11205 [Planctomycetota bacterium]